MANDAELVRKAFKNRREEFVIAVATNRSDFIKELRNFKPDIVLSDHILPGFNSLEALAALKYSGLNIPFILVTGNTSEDFVVKLFQEGMDDYILKDSLQRLPFVVVNALEKYRLEKETKEALEKVIESEAMMKRAEELAHLGSWTVELGTWKIKWSDEAYRIYGYEPGEMEPTNEKFLSHVHPDDLESVKSMVAKAISDCDSQEWNMKIIDKKSMTKYLRCKLIVERDFAKKAVRLIGFNLDVSELAASERGHAVKAENRATVSAQSTER
jgi:CheY-like chemotaxis protein